MPDFSYDGTSEQDDLVGDVKFYADMVTASGQSIGTLDEDVYQALVRALRDVYNRAPYHAVTQASKDGSGMGATNEQRHTRITVPNDFLRFLELRLEEWTAHLSALHEPRSERVQRQYNSATAADGYQPVATKAPAPGLTSGEEIRAWPQDSGPQVATFSYVPEEAPEEAPEDLRDAIVLQAAYYLLAATTEQGWQLMQDASSVVLRGLNAGERIPARQALAEADDE